MSISVAILGATGVVGQKAIALLSCNNLFDIIELVASEKRVGEVYGDVCEWREPLDLPEKISSMKFVALNDLKAEFVVSCLPADVAQKIEPTLASLGKIIFSNASAFRMTENVPLLVPEINSDHLALLDLQNTSGKIITNPNCAAVGVTLALAPLMKLGEIQHVSVVTLQSVSGSGFPGVSSSDILGNTIPHIQSEADKITEETKKILGSSKEPATFSVTTNVHRVPVMYGHSATLHVMFKDVVQVRDAIRSYATWNEKHEKLFVFHNKDGRPQAMKDLHHDDMRVHIGHLKRGDQQNILQIVCLTHNLVRGAAGAVIANMESYLKYQKSSS